MKSENGSNPLGLATLATLATNTLHDAEYGDPVGRLQKIAKERNHPIDDLLDWYRDDMEDLATKSDKDLQFIVGEYLDNITLYRGAPVETPFKPHCVTCIDCQHFTRGNHPHLGRCTADVKGALLGLWDTHLRGCGKFIEISGDERDKVEGREIVNKPKLRIVKS